MEKLASIRYQPNQRTYVVGMSHRSVLEVDVVRFEVDVTEQRLKRGASRTSPDQGRVEGWRDQEDSRLCVVHAIHDELVIPDVHCVPGRGISCWIERCLWVQFALAPDVRKQREVTLDWTYEESDGTCACHIHCFVILSCTNEDSR